MAIQAGAIKFRQEKYSQLPCKNVLFFYPYKNSSPTNCLVDSMPETGELIRLIAIP
jgi:hypothetical protein